MAPRPPLAPQVQRIEHEEEAITNALMKRIATLKAEKQARPVRVLLGCRIGA
jgi:hypothetical protein